MQSNKTPNKLANEKSPYLLQHAHNPVHWYPWGEEAFTKAKAEDKPIFLSVGYATCHWCHVMERESFEDEEVAVALNEHFVSIKVDREERPDIDHIYMSACQAMTGQGGWPLTIIMTPEKKPFFAGTYFPKHSKWGRHGLLELLAQIAELWETKREKLHDIGRELLEHLSRDSDITTVGGQGDPTEDLLHSAFGELRNGFDKAYGGFGNAPKFPMPHNLLFLMRYARAFNKKDAQEMVEKTLESMYRGGIYDHIGFGFSRYSTDGKWLVPHFEKMLYDNALLAYTYLDAYQATKKPFYEKVAREIFEYILRDMTSSQGAFYSAEDADSEGEEGKFYVWTPAEIKEILGGELGDRVCQFYKVTREGNFEGKNIPNLMSSERSVEEGDSVYMGIARSEDMEGARLRLFKAREKRVHPYKDDKILTAWNGLMIAALAKGAQVLGDESLAHSAAKAASFLQNHLCRPDGRLLARYRDGESKHLAYAEDYAFLIWGLIELYQATWDVAHLRWALELQKGMTELFWDDANGGFYFYGNDGEQLLVRNKEIHDGATPSGNSVATLNALRLARLTGESWLAEQADSLLHAFGRVVQHHPSSFSFFLLAVDFVFGGSQEIVVSLAGSDSDAASEMLASLREFYLPRSVVLGFRTRKEYEKLAEISEAVRGKSTEGRVPRVFVCRNFECRAPIDNPENLGEVLGQQGAL